MKRTLIAVAALIGLASAANAASVSIAADQATYNPGDTITLTVTGTANAGETSTQVFGDIILSGAGSVLGGLAVQNPLQSFGGFVTWVVGTNPCGPGVCTVMNQIGGLSPIPVSNTPIAVAIVTYTAGTVGIVNVDWDNSTFDFFGATNQPGASFEIVPEPTTAAMLGLGLLGLAVSGRRRA